MTFPQLPLAIGIPGILIGLAICAHGYWHDLVKLFPFLGRLRPRPMTLSEVVRRIAFESSWSGSFAPTDDWNGELSQQQVEALRREFFRPLGDGHQWAWGMKSVRSADDNGPSPIPSSFWQAAECHVGELLVFNDPATSYAWKGRGEECEFYSEIRFDTSRVDAEWKPRKGWREKPSIFLLWAAREKQARDDELLRHQQQWWRENSWRFHGPDKSSPPSESPAHD